MLIGIPRETRPGETRVAATPETVKKLAASGKHAIVVESGAGVASAIPDEQYVAAGATIGSAAQALGADIVLKVRGPRAAGELSQIKSGAMLVGLLNPFDQRTRCRRLRSGASPASRWSGCRASRVRSRWTCCRRRRISPATRQSCSPRRSTASSCRC